VDRKANNWKYIEMFINGREKIKRAKKFGFRTQRGTRATGQIVFAFMKTDKKFWKLTKAIRENNIKYENIKTLDNANEVHDTFVRKCWI